MRKSDKVLLDLLGNTLFDVPVKIPEDLDWTALYEEAKAQAVFLLVFDAAGKVTRIPDEISAKCTQKSIQYVFNNEQLLYEQQHVLALMRAHNIPCVILKGSSSALWYPNPALRIMGDIDILVPPVQQMEAVQILQADGYGEILDEDHHCHMTVSKNRISVEVHKEPNGLFLNVDDAINQKFHAYFADAIEKSRTMGEMQVLSDAHQAMVLVLHKLEHFLNGSLGLRQLCDWAVFVDRRMTQALWQSLKPALEDMGILYFTGVITRVCVDFLKLPLKKAPWAMAYATELSESVMQEILDAGNFGVKQNVQKYGQSFFTSIHASNPASSFWNALVKASKRNWAPCAKYPVLLPIGACAVLVRHIQKRRSGQRAAFKPLVEMKQAKAQQALYKSLKPFGVEQKNDDVS